MSHFSLVWSNLQRRKLRTVLTVLAVLVAFLLYGLLCTLKEALSAGVSMAGADRLIVRHKVSIIQLLPESYLARLLRIPGVAAAVHQTWFGGIYQDPKNFFPTMPVDPQAFLAMYPEFVLSADQQKAWSEKRTGAVVGRTTAERFGWKIGDRIPIRSPIWYHETGDVWEFDLVGIYDGGKKGTDTTQFYFRYDYFEEARTGVKGQVGWYVVRIRDPERAAEVARQVDEEFANSPYETKTEPEGAFAQGFAQQVGNLGAMLLAILSAVFFTILLVAGNTMAQGVRERTEELGVLKALGFTHERVLVLVLAESCALALVGGLTGLGLAWAMTLSGNPVPGFLPVFYFPPRDVGIGFALVLALGLVAGALPAWQAMRLRIADALRRGGG